MNYTNSGIIACGAPHSIERHKQEAILAQRTYPQALLLTEEGNSIANRFFKTLGHDPTSMPDHAKAHALNDPRLFHFLAGYLFAADGNNEFMEYLKP